ncbi:MAG: histidine phosphatase family protein [Candidatus Saccharibacteria bacterium]
MKALYFVRHGESEANAQRVWSPVGARLTDIGKWQATAAGCNARERDLSFGKIISSPLPRAYETARLIADELDYDVDAIEQLDLLAERTWGELAGVSGHDFFATGKTRHHMDDVPGVEKLESLQMRAANALNVLYGYPEDCILVVSHNTFGRALRRAINGLPHTAEYDKSMDEQRIPHAQIIRLI